MKTQETTMSHSEPAPARTLAQLAPGESGVIRRVRGKGDIHRRMLDMGISKGAEISMECVAPLGDPIKVRLRGYALSLRKSEAALVEISN